MNVRDESIATRARIDHSRAKRDSHLCVIGGNGGGTKKGTEIDKGKKEKKKKEKKYCCIDETGDCSPGEQFSTAFAAGSTCAAIVPVARTRESFLSVSRTERRLHLTLVIDAS